MKYTDLKNFITKEMRMSQIYQPVMLIELLKRKGTATVKQISQSILNHDPTQVEYYSEIVKNMVGKVLTKNRGITIKDGDFYHLEDFDKLTKDQIKELISLCESKIQQYEDKRKGSHWEHRQRGRKVISGSIRYEVLKRSKFRCENCGISADKRNLDVDHIIPKSLGGKDDISNYQSLCYVCNTNKGNRDSTDFRGQDILYEHREENCLFCDIQTKDKKRIISENTLSYVIRDGFPVSEGHTLIIPKRHVLDYFGLTQGEVNSINSLIHEQKELLDRKDKTIQGYNIGMNCGEISGQSVFHCHVHLIPRRKGDVEKPKGGIRNVIPHKGYYEDAK
jgi:ATP adenylyltransferase